MAAKDKMLGQRNWHSPEAKAHREANPVPGRSKGYKFDTPEKMSDLIAYRNEMFGGEAKVQVERDRRSAARINTPSSGMGAAQQLAERVPVISAQVAEANKAKAIEAALMRQQVRQEVRAASPAPEPTEAPTTPTRVSRTPSPRPQVAGMRSMAAARGGIKRAAPKAFKPPAVPKARRR